MCLFQGLPCMHIILCLSQGHLLWYYEAEGGRKEPLYTLTPQKSQSIFVKKSSDTGSVYRYPMYLGTRTGSAFLWVNYLVRHTSVTNGGDQLRRNTPYIIENLVD